VDIHERAFADLHDLEELYLSVASLSCLNQGVFAQLKKLKTLEIVFQMREVNDEESESQPPPEEDRLAAGVFKGLDSLTSLKINEFSNLRRLERESFRFLPNLESLTLNNNGIKSIEPHTFATFSKLREFDLWANQLEKFPSIENLHSLDTLKLSQNKISRIIEPGETRQVNGKLRTLQLNDGELAEVGPGAFSGFSNLIKLNLRGNKIAEWSSESLSGLSNVVTLDLGDNPFEKICAGLFADMGKLRYMELRQVEKFSAIDLSAFGNAQAFNPKIVVDIENRDDHPIAGLLKPFEDKGLITINAF
jgi:Leucine-rich repeat (LRR) protein